MYDIAGKVWSFLFGIFIIFIGGITLYAQKQDVVVQNYVDAAVVEFVDVSRATGYVSKSNYQAFIAKLDATGNVYNVEITHYSLKSAPSSDKVGYTSYYEATTKADIVNILNSGDGTYAMKTGDFLRVSVKNINPTLGRRLLGLLVGSTSEGGQIISSYGGYVGNES